MGGCVSKTDNPAPGTPGGQRTKVRKTERAKPSPDKPSTSDAPSETSQSNADSTPSSKSPTTTPARSQSIPPRNSNGDPVVRDFALERHTDLLIAPAAAPLGRRAM
ncbi:hypothetical protein NLU13_1420 [Sarocladium strictum]|uniref:Uncharacterized protein n=1 Tax=Sarocladium strictum TaxID=5046 RepID=A0AA39LC91_SARSR|nr:hypothetical protein NLU13_1420 [Sarocladium strictum]